ncbi:AMP-binding protein [Actinomycetospora sp. NBRC 106378]|uniref:class I adenylate-forming enzyme family protein n=1 Tax=Actinomycetospora sp. NBRC 106378 TaxID=3032208 RepID=UPI002555212C|nr:AMP-binding protein [Actinomycetospora sp. NBRC 106378]
MPAALPTRPRDTLTSLLARHAATQPERPALVFESAPGVVRTTSWGGWAARVAATAGVLRAKGVGHGDRVHVHLANTPTFHDVWFACAQLGAILHPTNPLATTEELRFLVGHSGARVSVTSADLAPTLQAAVEPGHDVVELGQLAELLADADPVTGPSPAAPTDAAALLYTSGTTSRPKGVIVSHAAYLHCGDAVAGHLRVRPDDRMLVVLPLFHGNGQYYSTMPALVTGAAVALTPRFSASRFSEQAHLLGATTASLFAAPIRMLLAAAPSPHDAAHRLRIVIFAQGVSDAQIAEFERRFAVPTVQLYGMTETVPPVTMNPPFEDRRGTSMGRPLLGTRVRLVDPEGGDVAPGEAGEVAVAGVPGRTMMTAYHDDPDATAAMLRPDPDGATTWLHTGDSARIDEDGYLHFVDRRKDMIKRAGENVATGEVEAVIAQHPAVFEVAVVGVPDDMRDEAVHAAVILHDGAEASSEELIEYCRERLAKFKVPDVVDIVPDLPRTSVGKIQKHRIRERILSGGTSS